MLTPPIADPRERFAELRRRILSGDEDAAAVLADLHAQDAACHAELDAEAARLQAESDAWAVRLRGMKGQL